MKPARALAAAAAVLVAAAGGVVATAAPAAAQTTLVQCVGAQSQAYYPPLTMTPKPTTVTLGASYTACTGGDAGVTSGSRQATVKYPARSCLDLLKSEAITYTITWNTGQTSIITGRTEVNVAAAALLVSISGTVTSGLYAGALVQQTIAGVTTDITLCTLGLGTVNGLSGLNSLTIAKVL
jgi:hypothetical protein